MRRPVLYPQIELAETVRYMIADTSFTTRYTDTQVYRAFDLAAKRWGKFRVPFVYEVGTLENAARLPLPDFMGDTIRIEVRDNRSDLDETITWKDLQGWEVVPDGDGLAVEFFHRPQTAEMRIIWFAPPPAFPRNLMLTADSVSVSDTQITASGPTDFVPARAGYLQIGDERIFYAGLDRLGNLYVLKNVQRGIDGSQAESHDDGLLVEVCLPVVEEEQYSYFMALVCEQLHMLFMTDGSPNERDNHAVAVQYWRTQAEEMRRRLSGRHISMRLGKRNLRGWT